MAKTETQEAPKTRCWYVPSPKTLGYVELAPSETQLSSTGVPIVIKKALSVTLAPAWYTRNELTKNLIAGPTIIDPEKFAREEVEAFEKHWGAKWVDKFAQWIEKNGALYGIKEGRPVKPTTLVMDEADADEIAQIMIARGKNVEYRDGTVSRGALRPGMVAD